ncbi:MAG TPA: hypothetical protein VFB29_06230 [Pseudolabrys sp.]|nr:hypothetical protein [Pseudolabrys sp.]
MKNLQRFFITVGLTAAVILSSPGGAAFAQNGPKRPIDPGSNPDTGQIDPGKAPRASSQSADVSNMPTTEEARAALLQPISRQPSAGGEAMTTGSVGGQMPGQSGQNASASGEPPPSGPIGAFGQTIPAKFSSRNDILDRVPIMARPMPLTKEQEKQIYDAVMAEKPQPVPGADALKPADELSPSQALTGMRPLPESVRGIESVSKLYYIKARDKILLIEPNVRTVVDQISAS